MRVLKQKQSGRWMLRLAYYPQNDLPYIIEFAYTWTDSPKYDWEIESEFRDGLEALIEFDKTK